MDLVSSNPTHEETDGWYFWDETWAYRHGPFKSKKECEIKLTKYANWLDTGDYEGRWDNVET